MDFISVTGVAGMIDFLPLLRGLSTTVAGGLVMDFFVARTVEPGVIVLRFRDDRVSGVFGECKRMDLRLLDSCTTSASLFSEVGGELTMDLRAFLRADSLRTGATSTASAWTGATESCWFSEMIGAVESGVEEDASGRAAVGV